MIPIFKTTFVGGKVYRPYGNVYLPAFGPCNFVEHLKAVLPVPTPLPPSGRSEFVEHLKAALPEYPLPPTVPELALAEWRELRREYKEDKARERDVSWDPFAPILNRCLWATYDLETFYERGCDGLNAISGTPIWGRPALKVPTYRARLSLRQQTRYEIKVQTVLLDKTAAIPTTDGGSTVIEQITVGDVIGGFVALLEKRLSTSQRKQLRQAQILETGNLRARSGYTHNGTQRDLLKTSRGGCGKHNLVIFFGGVERDGTVKMKGWWILGERPSADPQPQELVMPTWSRKRSRDAEDVSRNKRQRV